jgi:formate--tetrahydrofolate ligase
MLSDIEIANSARVEPIDRIAKKLNIPDEFLDCYGKDKAKISLNLLKEQTEKTKQNLILVTAITPTPLGEGKSTTTIGLVDGLAKIGKKVVGCLREPSLGPVFGVKGGACGGGYAQINPMAEINLHFTGDLHAITAANNLISACIDNHIYHGNTLKLDPNKIVWKRCVDLNDRALRKVQVGLDSKKETPRMDGYNITVASEIMAILCLATSMDDLRSRINRLIIGYNDQGQVVTVKDLGITGSVMVLLKDAMKPNLVQTLENNPIIVHGGPFANIAHGCNSILATEMGIKLADYTVTEAGFGADLGAEKFLDIKCREASLKVSCVVLVATIKALKYHGGINKNHILEENVDAMMKGLVNLQKHMNTLDQFKLPYVICLNRYSSDTKAEICAFDAWAKQNKVEYSLSEVFAKGGNGGIDLANKVINKITEPKSPCYIYNLEDSFEEKVKKIAQKVYGAKDVVFSDVAKSQMMNLSKDYQNYYICMAKTPASLTDDAKLVGYPKDFDIHVKEIRIASGAKFLICLTGDIMTMPGLPKEPLALKIDLDENGKIINLS